ncbi:hypothetical protein [Iningainema tapete]|uniref:Uncharacterized protein n=1 Tax=Iningainema tapete BLCC-T55 TaxID=2748662 RepID=A0A8J6XGK7_9CYAN|nr:hypothetical protein [Iningainema tapete]MBD2772122.1 hypothetical protein [Iningainema tapete BLCC-T55]
MSKIDNFDDLKYQVLSVKKYYAEMHNVDTRLIKIVPLDERSPDNCIYQGDVSLVGRIYGVYIFHNLERQPQPDFGSKVNSILKMFSIFTVGVSCGLLTSFFVTQFPTSHPIRINVNYSSLIKLIN